MYSMLDQNYITALVITYRGEISLYDRAEISIFNMAEMSMYDRAEMSMYDRPIVMARTTTACCPVLSPMYCHSEVPSSSLQRSRHTSVRIYCQGLGLRVRF